MRDLRICNPLRCQNLQDITQLHFLCHLKSFIPGFLQQLEEKGTEKGTDLFSRLSPRPSLPSLLYPHTHNPLDLIYETACSRQLTSLQSIAD
ncbi:hypothetical protein SAMN03159424_03615 [Pseudomonas sp. NFACC05-1]|nr:hypothetical protein SAMN03159424_03615 [Pseudomonas sp. NFACC05-1]